MYPTRSQAGAETLSDYLIPWLVPGDLIWLNFKTRPHRYQGGAASEVAADHNLAQEIYPRKISEGLA